MSDKSLMKEDQEKLAVIKSAEYQDFINWVCTDPEKQKIKTIVGIAKKINVCRSTIYEWLGLDATKKAVDKYISSMISRDKIHFYNALRKNADNPRMNRLFHDLYDWEDHSSNKTKNMILVFNLPSNPQNPIHGVPVEMISSENNNDG